MPDITLSTLGNIRTKIRRLTRSPSTTQISDAQIDEYINTFILYDFPEHLKLFSLRKVFSFYTKPYIDTYSTNTVDLTDPMYNFKNKYTSVHKQVTIAGYPTFVSLSREQFYGIYPRVESIRLIGTGNGVNVAFAGILTQVPVVRGEVVFSSVDINSNGLVLKDDPVVNSAIGNLVVPDSIVSVGTINYITGAYAFTFPVAPMNGIAINSQTLPCTISRPQAILYYDDKFVVRPVPDQPYRVDLEVYCRPTELLDAADVPDLSEWWQYIAYGASKKIFEDRLDEQSASVIFPEYKKQELLVLRRTIMNASNERTSSIYTEQVDISSGISGWGGNNV
jgi:hypothetical protein